MDPTPRWVPGDARSRPAGRGRAPGGLSAPALAIQGAGSRVPALGAPGPARPDSGTSSARPLASRPLPRHPFPGAPLPTPLSHLRCSTSRKHLRNRPAQEAPPLSPDPPPLRSPQDGRYFPSALRRIRLAHPLRVATHLGSGAALPPPQTSADK